MCRLMGTNFENETFTSIFSPVNETKTAESTIIELSKDNLWLQADSLFPFSVNLKGPLNSNNYLA